ncbi:hypothetical protein TCE0_022f06357 [Talaromyces pinophilus]|uniref:Uncharacterized protein n=1 Tax=Talaromyces pinophilus TaxID=128442 RepID=A0A6V8H895_TALPI|nr:hypothetical protein TCE0_022f06357 [Talaromyces pinophilus]
MASVSDTEDGWTTLEEMPAASDDESIKQASKQSAPDLQSKVDALQEKTDLLQLQIKLKDDTIKALTNRLDASEAIDLPTRNYYRDTTRMMANHQSSINIIKDDVNDLKTQSKDCKSSSDALADSVNGIEVKAKCLEDETIKRLEEQTGRMNTLETDLVDLIDETDERVDWAMDEMEDLRANVKRIEKDVKDHIESEQTARPLVDPYTIDAIQRDVKSLQSQSEDDKFSMDGLTECVKDMENTTKRLEKEINECLELGYTIRIGNKSTIEGIECKLYIMRDDFDSYRDGLDSLQGQSKASADSIEVLKNRVDVLARSIEHVEYENSESLHRETLRLNTLEDIKMESEDHIEKHTAHMDALENYLESRAEAPSERVDRAVTEVNARLEDARIGESSLQSDIRLNKGFIRFLTKRVDALETNIERVERENSERRDERLKKEHEFITAVDESVQGLEENTKDCFELETARVKGLEDKVERLQQKTKDSINRGIAVAGDQSKVDAMKGDIETLQSQSKDYKSSIDVLTNSVKDVESKTKRFERKADHINAIGSALQNLEKAIKALDAKVECLERQEKDIQCQTRSLMEGLRNSINDCLKQTYTDFSGLTQRVKILEGARQKSDSVYTAAMLNQENLARSWDVQLYGTQNGAGYSVFVPSYVNGSVRR